VLPLRSSVYRVVGDEVALGEHLKGALPESGVYELPHPKSGVPQEELAKRYTNGPIAEIMFLRNGSNPTHPARFLHGLLQPFVCFLIMGLALRAALLPALPTPGDRFKLIVLAALAGSLFSHLTYPIWYDHSWHLALFRIGYDLTSWILAGLILSRFVRAEGTVD